MTTATTERPHVVLCQKQRYGERPLQVVFTRCPPRREAELTAEKLRAVGCPCTVELARRSDIAGISRRA